MFDEAFFSRPGHLISRIARMYARLGDERLRSLGFSVSQLPVLGLLHRGTAMTQKDLAQYARIEQSSMAQMLSRMERDGLISRSLDPDDKRSYLIRLTDEARLRLPLMFDVLTEGNAEALNGFSDDEKAALCALLKKLVRNLEAIGEKEPE